MHSTDSISVIIAGVQDETNATIMATEQGTRQAREVGELMASTATMLEESILATQQQKSAADQVDAAIQQIREAADQLARSRRSGPPPPSGWRRSSMSSTALCAMAAASAAGAHSRAAAGRLGGYAMPIEHVLEVADLGQLTAVPGAGPEMLGVRNLHGQILPVVDLAPLLGIPRRCRRAACSSPRPEAARPASRSMR